MLAVNGIRYVCVVAVNADKGIEEALLHIGNQHHLALRKIFLIYLHYSEALAVYGSVDEIKLVLVNDKVGARLGVGNKHGLIPSALYKIVCGQEALLALLLTDEIINSVADDVGRVLPAGIIDKIGGSHVFPGDKIAALDDAVEVTRIRACVVIGLAVLYTGRELLHDPDIAPHCLEGDFITRKPFGTSFIEKNTGGIGALGDIGCYSLDMVLNAIGYPKPLTVTGYKSAFFGTQPSYYPKHPEYAEKFGVDDFAAGFVRLEGGIILDFRISWAMNMDTAGDTLILGTKGGLRIPSTECWNGSVGGPMKIYKEIAGSQVEITVPIINETASLFDKKIRSFLDAVKEGSPAPIPSSQIIINQAILDGIVRSSELGKEIEITIPEV